MEEKPESNDLLMSESAKNHLRIAANWVYVISIIGLTIVIGGIIHEFYDSMSLSQWDDVPTGGGVGYALIGAMTQILLLIGIVCFFPLYYLYKFSLNVRIAFRDDDSEALEDSFRYLKLHYIAIGISPLCVFLYFLVASIF